MITLVSALWLVSWRYRLRPRTADQHAEGTLHSHLVMQQHPGSWTCLTCGSTSVRLAPVAPVRYWVVTIVCLALTVALMWLGAVLASGIVLLVGAVL